MTEKIKLSKRLTTVANFLSAGVFFADIGSDHAYLPCYVCLKDPYAQAIAGEVNVGPYKSAHETVTTYQLEAVINVRLGDGLEVIEDDQITELVIAGMGGALITSILEAGKIKLGTVKRIIVQPNVSAHHVRNWFIENNYYIENEAIIEENDHIYEVLVASSGKSRNLNEKELLFGPLLLKDKPAAFIKKWEYEAVNLQRIISEMSRAKVVNEIKIAQLERKRLLIQEVLM